MAVRHGLPGHWFSTGIRTVLAVLAVALLVQGTGAPLRALQPPTLDLPPAPARRILVKVRPALAQAIEAGLSDPAGTMVQGTATDPAVSGFFGRCPGGRLTALHPDLILLRKAQGVTDAQIADQARRRYPRRTLHLTRPVATPELSRTYVLEAGAATSEDLAALATRLAGDPEVEYAEIEHVATACYSANDPFLLTSGSWGQVYADLWGLADIGAPAAWNLSTGSGIVVAVVDSGIDSTHPDIAANCVAGWDFIGSSYASPVQGADPVDRYGHGTHVAGTIAAAGNNGIGIIGVAPGAKVMALKALDDAGYGTSATLAQAILYAANHGADVINASWTSEGQDTTIAEAIQYASSVGVVFVAAAGNASRDAGAFLPGNATEAITVASLGPGNQFSSFSNFGTRIDVAAPGENILSLRATGTTLGAPVGDGYVVASGTSMAAPHVAGLVALLLAQEPDTPIETIRQRIRASATTTGSGDWDLHFGYGILDADGTLAGTPVLQARITAPASGLAVTGAVTVSGTAQGASFAQYLLEYGAGQTPSSWVPLRNSSTPVAAGSLGTFRADLVPDGTYTLRLTATDSLGASFADRTEVRVAYLGITSPAPPQCRPAAATFKPGALVPILGTAAGPSFQGFRIQWARSVDPAAGWSSTGIQLAGGGAAAITGGQLGTWDTTGITDADDYTVRLLVDDQGFTSQALTLVRLEPSLVSQHWPKLLTVAPNFHSGLVPALDASGATTLVVEQPVYLNTTAPPALLEFSPDGARQQSVTRTAWSYCNPSVGPLGAGAGQDIVVPDPTSAVTVRHADGSSTVLQPAAELGNLSFGSSQIVLAELGSGTGRDVVALGEVTDMGGVAYLLAWHPDGSLVGPRFPITIPNLDATVAYSSLAPRVLVGDLDGDGAQDFVVVEGRSSSTYTLARYDRNGESFAWAVPEFSEVSGLPSVCDLALADLDHDGKLQTLLIAGGRLHVFQPDGSERSGWPQVLAGNSGHLAVGDLDLDGKDEIVVSNSSLLMVYRTDGTAFSSAWPRGATGSWSYRSDGHPILADVDGDGCPEILGTQYKLRHDPILFSTSGTMTYTDSALVAEDWHGVVARSWQLTGMDGLPPYHSAVITVGDFNQDGLTEIGATYFNVNGTMPMVSGAATVLATGVPFHASANPWPMIYHDTAHTATRSGLVLYPGILPDAQIGVAYTQQLTAAGGKAPYACSLASGSLPPGLSLSSTGLVFGTPTQTGSSTFRVAVRDQANTTMDFGCTLAVQVPTIFIQPSILARPVVGATYSANLEASGGTAPYSFAIRNGRLPAGLTLASDGAIRGTCTASARHILQVMARDANGYTGWTTYDITPACPTISILPDTLDTPVLGGSYAITLRGSGGTAPYAFTITSGDLPSGLALATDGTLGGACSTGGTYSFEVTATDIYGCTGTKTCTLAVVCPAIALAPTTLAVPVVGSAYSVQFSADGGRGPYTFTLASGSLPAGLALANSGLLSGTCSAGGSASFRVAATDRNGCLGSQDCTLLVAAPALQASPAQAGLLPGRTAVFTVTQTGLGDAGLSWAASGGTLLPSGHSATFSAQAAGSYTITATSAADPQAAVSITVQVHGAGFTRADGAVCGQDALLLIGAMGGAGPAQDLDGDNQVDGSDLALLLNALGW